MGADAVYVYYGVKRSISEDDLEQLDALETDSHAICSLARDHKLQFTWGCLTDGEDYFLLIGSEIGRFGVEGLHEQIITHARLAEIMAETTKRLKAAGIAEVPALHVQLQAQY